jgi:phospholipase A1/A2
MCEPVPGYSVLSSALLCAVLVLSPWSTVSAQAAGLRECAALEDSMARLACYDALAAEAGIQARDVVSEASPTLADADLVELPSAVESRMEQSRLVRDNWFSMTPYRPNYFLPVSYNRNPNREPFERNRPAAEMDRAEAKFQFSLEFDVWRNVLGQDMDLYFGYTQQGWWQMYNRDDSSPFREVNHEPELGVILRPDLGLLGMQMRQLRLGVVHHSNGRDEPLSRSWNRIFSTMILDRGDFATALRVWYRIPESDSRDDNPDITDFYGNFEWYGFYKWRRNTLGIMVRNNLQRNDNRGALQVDWSYPLSERLKFYMQYFNGYGESLIDYNHSTHRLGVGLMLTDWL